MSTDEQRDTLREKIELAEARNEERTMTDYAREARDGATDFVKAHPLATVAGALAIGAVVAAIVPGPGRRLSKKVGTRAVSLAAIATELALTYGTGMLASAGKAALTGQDRLEDLGDTVSDSARSLRRETGHRVAKATDSANSLRKTATKKAGRTMRDLRGRIN